MSSAKQTEKNSLTHKNPLRAFYSAINFTPFNPFAVPFDTILHPDLKEEATFFTNPKNISLAVAAVVAVVLVEYVDGGGGTFIWLAVIVALAVFILAMRPWSEHLWRKYASWIYRTAMPVEAEAYFYMMSEERHSPLLNIIFADGSKETVTVHVSRYDASKLLDQKQTVTVRRDTATGGAAIILDCHGKLYWCTP